MLNAQHISKGDGQEYSEDVNNLIHQVLNLVILPHKGFQVEQQEYLDESHKHKYENLELAGVHKEGHLANEEPSNVVVHFPRVSLSVHVRELHLFF